MSYHDRYSSAAKVNHHPVTEEVLSFLFYFIWNCQFFFFNMCSCVDILRHKVHAKKVWRERGSLKYHEGSLNKTRITVFLESFLAEDEDAYFHVWSLFQYIKQLQRQQKTVTSLQQLLESNTSILKAACTSGSISFSYPSTNSLPSTLILQFRASCAGNCSPDQDSCTSAISSERLTWIRNLHCVCYRCAQCSREDTLLAGDSKRGLKLFASLWNTDTPDSSTMDGKATVVPRELKSLHLVLAPVLAQLQTSVIWTGFSFMKESMKLSYTLVAWAKTAGNGICAWENLILLFKPQTLWCHLSVSFYTLNIFPFTLVCTVLVRSSLVLRL